MSSVLVGMFDSQSAANEARAKLLNAGFAASAVSLTAGPASSGTTGVAVPATAVGVEPHHQGAISRFFSDLFGTDDDAHPDRAGYTDTYTEAFNRGSCGVSVTTANDAVADRAEMILNASGAVDIDEKAASWRKDGWTGGAAGALTSPEGVASNLEVGATRKLQEIEEHIQVGKRVVAKGGVRVFSRMVEVPVQESVLLREEHADIQRRVVDRPATEADFSAFKEGSIEVRSTAEEAVVGKTARVVSEVEIGKTTTEREEVVRDTVRKTEVDVEQIVDADLKSSGSVKGSGTKPI